MHEGIENEAKMTTEDLDKVIRELLEDKPEYLELYEKALQGKLEEQKKKN